MESKQPVSIAAASELIQIEEPAGIGRCGEAVRFGVPFAPGEWPAGAPMGLASKPIRGAGRALSWDWRVTQAWPDGSARLAFCTAEIELDSQAILVLTPSRDSQLPSLQRGSPPQIAGVSCSVTMGGENREQPLAVMEAGLGGETPKYRELEPLCLQAEGVSISGAVRALAGRDALYTITICNGGAQDVQIDLLRIVANGESRLGGECRAQLGSEGGGLRLEEAEQPELLQLTRVGHLRASSRDDAEIQYPLGGECRQNLFWGRVYNGEAGATLAVRNMGENFPCGISLGRGRIFIDLWPEEVGKMDLPAGMSKTYEFGIVFDGGGQEGTGLGLVQSIHHPLVVRIPTNRLEELGCFGTLGPYLPRKFPKLESWTKWILANRPRAYGWRNFGDEPAFGYMPRAKDPAEVMFLNNEYDFPLIALGQFCRTGDKIAYEDGRAAVLHMMDIDTVAADVDPMKVGGQYSHSPEHTTHPPAPDHEWLEGLLLWHVLTGEQRPLDSARALADRHVRLTESGAFDQPGMTSRRYGWPLLALSSFYAFSREQRYLDAATRIVGGMQKVEDEAGSLRSPYWGLPYWSLDTFMLGIATAGLCRYHAVTQCADTEGMILRACDSILSLATPEGILPYKEYPLVRVNEPVSTTIALEALAYGFELSGKRDYLVLGAHNLENTFDMLRGGTVLEWNAEQRESFPGGAYMRARTVEMNAQLIGLLLRGIWPFMATAERAGIFGAGHNPFAFVSGSGS